VADSRPFITAKPEMQRAAKKRTKMPKKFQVLCKYSGRGKERRTDAERSDAWGERAGEEAFPEMARGRDQPEASSDPVDIPGPLDFAKIEAKRIEGLLELELGTDRPWFIAFRSARNPGFVIIYHSPAGNSIGYTEDDLAVGSILIELCGLAMVRRIKGPYGNVTQVP
jgi:hypothetical protein